MADGITVRFNGLGWASVAVGILALIAVAIPQWVAPPPPRPVEMHMSLKQRIAEKLKTIGQKKERVRHPTAGWREGVPFIAIVLAALAVLLGALAVLRGEEHLYAGVGAILGFGALGFQLTVTYAVAACIIQIMYAATERPAGGVVLALIGACGIAVLSLMAAIGMDEDSALLLVGAALAILGIKGAAYMARGRKRPTATAL
jgi:hypothetical protein